MKNKIKNTEMEYIAKANCGVDSSFLTDGFRSDWNIFIFFLKASRITVLCESVFALDSGRSLRILSKRTKEVITSAGSVYIYI